MGIYIKDMKMPIKKNGTVIIVYPDGRAFTSDEKLQAVELPPHGRCIDASEKIRVQIYDDMTEDYHMYEMTIDDLLSQGWVEANAPTIIEAEEGE